MSTLELLFSGPEGRVSSDPLAVAPEPRTVDLAALALFLTTPAAYGEFLPACPWVGVTLQRPEPGGIDMHERDVTRLDHKFHDACVDLVANAERVGVQLSGGLDSLAVLVHTTLAAPGRDVVAYTIDMVDDEGRRAADVARGLIDSLGLKCGLAIVDPNACEEWPVWSPVGPRLDALPGANAAVAVRAAADGVMMLLSGDGADEILATPRFAGADIARRHGLPALIQYLRDVRQSESGLWGEALAILSRVAPRTVATRLYWAVGWPEWSEGTVPDLLMPEYRDRADAWTRNWIRTQIERHSTADPWDWSMADSFDSFWPHDPIPAAGSLEERSPFLHPVFLSEALNLPAARRYDPRMSTRYHRTKSAVVELFPDAMVGALPRRKQYYSRALGSTVDGRLDVPRAIAAGLVDPDALLRETDTAVRMNVCAVERWLAGAQQSGAAIPGVCSASAQG